MAYSKFGIDTYLTSTGIFAPEIDIEGDTVIKLITSDAGSSNSISVYGRIAGQKTWDLVGTITGSNTKDFDVTLYDFIRLECTNFTPVSTRVKLVGSGFKLQAGLTSVVTPLGSLTNVENLVLTSTDSSVTISSTSPNVIDIRSVGGVGGSPALKYTKTVLLTDWTGPVANVYTLTILASLHGITNPIVTCYESNGVSYDLLLTGVNVDASNNITLTASQTPDTRFIGKIVIE